MASLIELSKVVEIVFEPKIGFERSYAMGDYLFDRDILVTHSANFDLFKFDEEVRKIYEIRIDESMSDYLMRLFPEDFDFLKKTLT